MYNFAQALSAGYVKLIDWKSIENANMATVEFKTQLLESAVACGTLTKTADGMYKTVKGNVIDATHNFNDSLQDQWMTTEALVGTLVIMLMKRPTSVRRHSLLHRMLRHSHS